MEQIEKTWDYEKFKLILGNRRVDESKVKEKIKILSESYHLDVFPIVVNENFEIIDGQHRFFACKKMNAPVHYIVKKGLGIDNVQKINTHMYNWSYETFMESYASRGNINYVNLMLFLKKHDVKIYEIYHLLGKGNTTSRYTLVKTGEIIFDTTAELICTKFIHFYLPIKNILGGTNHALIGACAKLYKNEELDPQRLYRKLKLVPESYLKLGLNVKETLRILEDIYNYQQMESTQIRFF